MHSVKIKTKGLSEFIFLTLTILISYRFFYLVEYPRFLALAHWIYNRALIYALISSVYFLIFKKLKSESKWLRNYCIVLYLVVFATTIYSVALLPRQSLYDTVRVASTFLIPVLSVMFLDYFIKVGTVEHFFSFLNIVSFIWNILIIVQSILYKNGILLFDFQSYFIGDVYVRNEGIRMGTGILSQCMILYNFSFLFQSTKKTRGKWIYHLILFVVGMYCIFFIAQTRAEQVYILVALASIVFIGGKNLRSKLVTVLALVAGIYLLTNSDFLDKIIVLLGTTARNTNSVINRKYAYQYYWTIIKTKPLFGNGFALTTNIAYPYYSLEHGSLGRAFYSDVGIVGLLANIGMTAIFVYIWPLFRMGKILLYLIRRSSWKQYSYELSIYIYIVLSSATLITTDGEKMFQFAFLLAFFEYVLITFGNRKNIK